MASLARRVRCDLHQVGYRLGGSSGSGTSGQRRSLSDTVRDIIFELVAAGVEHGSKRAILDEWTLDDVAGIRAHWREHGPPVHIAIAHISSAYLGLKLTADAKPKKVAAPIDIGSIDMSDAPQPVAGGDTMAASMAILAKLQAMHA